MTENAREPTASLGQSLALLVAFQHVDAIFPSGSFAFSNGLEASVSLAAELGSFDIDAFVAAQILHRWASADRVALVRAHRLNGDLDAVAALDCEVEASLVSEAFRLASRRNGAAFLTAHGRLGTVGAQAYRTHIRNGRAQGHLPVMQGLVWRALGVTERVAALMSGYAAVSGLTSAAVRLGLVGAIAAQAVIARALPLIEQSAAVEIDDDMPLESFLPLAEIAVARHGTAGVRLFSN
jgi:urease accessory protein